VQDVEVLITNVVIVTGVLSCVVTLLLLLLAASPPAIKRPIRAKIVQYTEPLIEFLDRGAHADAVFIVLSLTAALLVGLFYLIASLK
jgi:hypothetical protein